jgi:hypothetical protein
MVGTQNLPPSINALSTYVSAAIDQSELGEQSFESIEQDCKRVTLQSIVSVEYANQHNLNPQKAWGNLREAALSNQNHALHPLFQTKSIDATALPVEQVISVNASDWESEERGGFDAISNALETFTEYQPSLETDELLYKAANDDRRVSGTYLTPVTLAERSVRPAIKRKFRERCQEQECWPGNFGNFETVDEDDVREVISSLSIVDPACGSGSMLLGVIEVLAPVVAASIAGTNDPDAKEVTTAKRLLVKNAFYGADANRLSREACLTVLWVEAGFDARDFGPDPTRFVVGDSLRGSVRQQRLTSTKGEENGATYREQLRPIDWGKEFDRVFSSNGGFDVVVTNPPWERVKVQTREFLAARQPKLAEVATSAERGAQISGDRYESVKADLEQARDQAKDYADEIRNSADYEWTNVGMMNLYSLFVERSMQIIADSGYCALIVPTGIATDYYTSDFFEHLTTEGKLVSLYDFENRNKLFEDVDGRTRFSLLTLSNEPSSEDADFIFFAHNPADIDDESRHVRLGPREISELNPITNTAPLVRGREALRILQKQHESAPIFVEEKGSKKSDNPNPWGVTYKRMFDMSTDSDRFISLDELSAGTRKTNGDICGDSQLYKRLYEGRMVDQYNHRASHAKDADGNLFRSGTKEPTEEANLADPNFTVNARYYLPSGEVDAETPSDYPHDWFIGFKDITSATNSRTMIASVLPRTAVGNKLPLLLTSRPAREVACLLANLNSMAYDFACRQKIGNVTLNWYIVRQTPVLPPERYRETIMGESMVDWVSERVAELTYTANDLDAWGDDLGFQSEPYDWDSERRMELRAELDGLFFHLYGLTENNVEHIIDSFGALRRRGNGDFEYKAQVLEAYRSLADKISREQLNESPSVSTQ